MGDSDAAPSGSEARPGQRANAALTLGLFFAASFAYVWLRLQPSLLYHSYWPSGSFPVFRLNAAFFRSFLSYPGGLLEYASAFLAQLYYAAWSGALVIAGVATLLCVAMRALLKAAAGVRLRVWHLVPGLLFLWPYNRYWNELTAGLGVLLSLLAAAAYAGLPWRKPFARLMAFLVFALLLYYLAGGFSALLAVLCGLVELLHRRRYALGSVCIACALVIPWGVGVRLWGLFWDEAYLHLLPAAREAEWVSGKAAVALYGFCLLAVTAPAAARAVQGRRPFAALARLAASRASGLWGAGALALIACGVFGFTFDRELRSILRIDCLSQEGKWEALLREARNVPFRRFDVNVAWDVNRALFYTGRLGDQMFHYPQTPGSLLPMPQDFHATLGSHAKRHAMALMKCAQLMYDLGRVNEAEHMTAESMEVLGRRPAFLKRLFQVSIAKGRREVALKFLNALAEDPMHRGWAVKVRERLAADAFVSSDPDVQRLRALMAIRPNVVGDRGLEPTLLEQLAGNPRDRMAFEYLMAHYLLTKQLDKFAARLAQLGELGFSRLPQHYQEAMLLLEEVTGKPVEAGGLAVSDEARERFFRFQSLMARSRGDIRRAWQAAIPGYRGTYFFYFVFYGKPGL